MSPKEKVLALADMNAVLAFCGTIANWRIEWWGNPIGLSIALLNLGTAFYCLLTARRL